MDKAETEDFVDDTSVGESSLYETDFYAWTQQQAALMKEGCLADLDLMNVLEEIESLGRKEVSELRSRYKILSLHLLTEMYQPERSGRSWRTTILDQRLEIGRHIIENPSLKPKADQLFDVAYADARRLAASETGLRLDTFPIAPPFSRELMQSESWYPTPAAGSSDVEPGAGR